MRHLLSLFALLLSCSMLAQGPVEFPWNPDSDGDDFIGVNDLMALLGEFDSVFSEEALYLSEDSTSAMYDAGTLKFLECQIACNNLPGRWSIPKLNEVHVEGQEMWLNSSIGDMIAENPFFIATSGNFSRGPASYALGCFCVTKERPKVEYSFCTAEHYVMNVPSLGDHTSAFQECCDEKVENGWYPLGGFSKGYTSDASQAFWRWAE